MKVAIVGAGVAGLAAASRLHPQHEIAVFEAADHVGGHTRTERIVTATGEDAVDTGFVVFNHATYPEFTAELARLGVATRPTSMSFSVSDRRRGLEYGGESLDAVFAQRRNLARPSFLRMLGDIQRFNREAVNLVEGPYHEATLSELVAGAGYSTLFRDAYLVPMGAAIWSASDRTMHDFPAKFFVRFLRNHGLLQPPSRQLRWRVVEGGSSTYVRTLARPFSDRVRVGCAVRDVRRAGKGVRVAWDGDHEHFDHVVLACHADQALRLLGDATALEHGILASFPYAANHALLHTDIGALPRNRRAWASWNHHVEPEPGRPVSITYDMTRLQGLSGATRYLVTLNDVGRVDPRQVLRRIAFDHPVFTRGSIAAQQRWGEISGVDRVHFAGAYWRHGFHEDGWVSGIRVARAIDPRVSE